MSERAAPTLYGRASTPCGLTDEQFMVKYAHIVRSVVRQYIPRELGDTEDLCQEIWTQFLTGKHGTPYIQIYDPAKAAPTTFMWEFARTRCLQFLSRSKRTPTARAFSIQSQPDDAFVVGIVDPETTKELGFDERLNIEFNDLVVRAEHAIYASRQRGKRDLRWVWTNIKAGMRQDQIAQEMGLSEGTISICMDLLRQIPEVQELRTWGVENGLLETRLIGGIPGPR